MMRHRLRLTVPTAIGVGLLLTCLAGASTAQPVAPAGARQPLLVEGKRSVSQRILLRPTAMVSPTPGAPGLAGLGFAAYYVYATQTAAGEEWLEIGVALDGKTEGWVKTSTVLQWNHGMVAAFTNPAGRGRGMFMATDPAARALIGADGQVVAQRLRAEAVAGRPAAGVVALEPDRFVDISKNFYLLPILNAAVIDREVGGPVRVLEVVSAPAERNAAPQPASVDALARFRAGLIFVVDTTLSMQPYIDRTRDAITGIVNKLGTTAVRDNFRFGVVGYRDSEEATPRNYEYTARMFAQPDFTRPPDSVLAAMQPMAATTTDNLDFDEDPIAGLKEAIDKVDWAPLGGRYLVLITDAGGREAADPRSSTHQGVDEMRILAREKGITLFVIHLLTPEGRIAGNHTRARRLYTALTDSPAGPLYYGVEDGAQDKFQGTVAALVEGILGRVAETTGRPIAELRGAGGGAPAPQAARIEAQLRVVAEAMRLSYLGREQHTTAPDIVRSFALDRDPAPPGSAALDVRVLLTRNQLDDLSRALEEILRAGRSTRLDERAFFVQLQSALTLAARDPSRIAQAGTLGGLLGEYLDGLPYASEVMGLTDREWQGMGPSGQSRLLNNIEAKLRLYREFNRNADLWVTLSGRHDAGDQVFPVPLDALP